MIWGFCVYFVYMIPLETDVLRKHRFQKEIRMHIAKRKELDVHKSKRKRCRNRTTTSLVLDSKHAKGYIGISSKPANLVAFIVSICEPPNIFYKDISCYF